MRLTTDELSALADGGAGVIAASGAQHVAYVGTGGAMLPLLLFSAARAAVAGHPAELPVERRRSARTDRPPADAAGHRRRRIPSTSSAGSGKHVISSEEFLAAARTAEPAAEFADPDSVAVVLFTSGTTSRPKAVELTHNNLTSYITGTVEFGSAEPEDAALICVPPYHIAGVSAALSNLYAGRKMVYLTQLRRPRVGPPGRRRGRHVGHGGADHARPHRRGAGRGADARCRRCARWPTADPRWHFPWCARRLSLLPDVGFVNAYGLTETSSTIAVLTPDDHRAALGASDDAVARRLGSVGQPVPSIEVQIRADDGTVLGPGEPGELYVRGEQVSGKYTGIGSVLDDEGWFPTKDVAYLDADGYLFIGGRSDDTIIRGGENIAPAEIEDVLVEHPHVHDCAVVGAEDPQWGQIIVAVVVPASGATPDAEDLRSFVRGQLRGSRTPDRVVFRDELPTNATGKVLRRELVSELNAS